LITVKNLVKNFGKNAVLKSIDLTIDAGKVTAIVGPNGSGKTTLIKTILGLVRPTSGIIEVDGKSIKDDYLYRNKIGYMPQIARYPENLTGNEIILLIKSIRNSDEFQMQKFSSLKLEPEWKSDLKSSGGTKQKISALIALLSMQNYNSDEPQQDLIHFQQLLQRSCNEAERTKENNHSTHL
jgi:Cu-processing system ATP-binding protein